MDWLRCIDWIGSLLLAIWERAARWAVLFQSHLTTPVLSGLWIYKIFATCSYVLKKYKHLADVLTLPLRLYKWLGGNLWENGLILLFLPFLKKLMLLPWVPNTNSLTIFGCPIAAISSNSTLLALAVSAFRPSVLHPSPATKKLRLARPLAWRFQRFYRFTMVHLRLIEILILRYIEIIYHKEDGFRSTLKETCESCHPNHPNFQIRWPLKEKGK